MGADRPGPLSEVKRVLGRKSPNGEFTVPLKAAALQSRQERAGPC